MYSTAGWLLRGFGPTGGGSLPVPTDVDPFTQVYMALWYALLENPNFTDKVLPNNRIAYVPVQGAKYHKALVDTKQAADFPEVQIVAEGGVPHHHNTSSSSRMRRIFSIMLSTSDLRLNASLFPVEWEIFRAVANWRSNISLLEYNGEQFVKGVRNLETTTGYRMQSAGTDVQGWASVWRAEVDMHFSNDNQLELPLG